MKATRACVPILAALCLAVLLGCGGKASDGIDFGSFQGSTYTNEYFAMSLTIPEGWSVQTHESLQQMAKVGGQVIAGDDQNLQASMRAAELQTVNLFAAFERPVGTPVPYNPSIVAVAEHVSHMPGIKSGKDYLYHARQLLEAGQLKVTFLKEVPSVRLGGVEFHTMAVQLSMAGRTMTQQYYAAVMKGYALGFVISYVTDAQRTVMESALKTLTFGQQ